MSTLDIRSSINVYASMHVLITLAAVLYQSIIIMVNFLNIKVTKFEKMLQYINWYENLSTSLK